MPCSSSDAIFVRIRVSPAALMCGIGTFVGDYGKRACIYERARLFDEHGCDLGL